MNNQEKSGAFTLCIILFILGTMLGMLIMINQVCKEKDRTINMLKNGDDIQTLKPDKNIGGLPKIPILK